MQRRKYQTIEATLSVEGDAQRGVWMAGRFGFNRRARIMAMLGGAWLALVATRIAMRLISVGTGTRPVLELAAITAAVNAFWLIAGPIVAWSRSAAPRLRQPWLRAAGVAGACVATILAEPLWYRIVLTGFHGAPLPWIDAVVARGDVNVLLVILVVAGTSILQSYAGAAARQRQRDDLESDLLDTETRALTLQLQPHFLFNTLQLAAEAAYDDIAAAQRIVRDLETLLQRSFTFEEQPLVRVADEIDFLSSYVAIQRRRFGSRLTVDIRVDPAARERLIPPLLLQPLVENSIQHGLGSLARDGCVVVEVGLQNDALRIEVRDDGVGFRTEALHSTGLGLGVTQRRLKALYGERHTLNTGSAAEGGAAVTILLAGSPAVPETVRAEDASTLPAGTIGPDRRARAIAALAGVAALTLALIGLGEVVLRQGFRAPSGPGPIPGSIAGWIPAQILLLACVAALWRVFSVRGWLHERDREASRIRARIHEARERLTGLRAGKEIMLTGLARLAYARTPLEFDRLIMNTSDFTRSLLAGDRAGRASHAHPAGQFVDRTPIAQPGFRHALSRNCR